MNEPLNRTKALLNSVTGQHLFTNTKEKRLVEYAAEDPLYVLNHIFHTGQLKTIKEYSLQWFHVALCVDLLVYEDAESRSALLHFFYEVQRLIDALYIIKYDNEQTTKRSVDDTRPGELTTSSLYYEERLNPMLAVVKFFSTFSIRTFPKGTMGLEACRHQFRPSIS